MTALLLGSSAAHQRIRWLRLGLDKRERVNLCARSPWGAPFSSRTHGPSVPSQFIDLLPVDETCSLFYFHTNTWKAVGQKQPLLLSFYLLCFSVALSCCPCRNMLHESWLIVQNIFLLVSYLCLAFSYYPALFPLSFSFSACLIPSWLQHITVPDSSLNALKLFVVALIGL